MKHKKNKKRTISDEVLNLVKQVENALNVTVRLERGHFKSGHCFLKDQHTLILNKNQSNDLLESYLVAFLEEHGQGQPATAS